MVVQNVIFDKWFFFREKKTTSVENPQNPFKKEEIEEFEAGKKKDVPTATTCRGFDLGHQAKPLKDHNIPSTIFFSRDTLGIQ